jgi:hypothetical protein
VLRQNDKIVGGMLCIDTLFMHTHKRVLRQQYVQVLGDSRCRVAGVLLLHSFMLEVAWRAGYHLCVSSSMLEDSDRFLSVLAGAGWALAGGLALASPSAQRVPRLAPGGPLGPSPSPRPSPAQSPD